MRAAYFCQSTVTHGAVAELPFDGPERMFYLGAHLCFLVLQQLLKLILRLAFTWMYCNLPFNVTVSQRFSFVHTLITRTCSGTLNLAT